MWCGPAWISTWAMTVSRTTRVTRPTNRLRADSETSGCGSRRSADAASSVAKRAKTAPSILRRPEPSVVVATRPLSAHRRTVSSLTPSRSAASRMRKIDTPEPYRTCASRTAIAWYSRKRRAFTSVIAVVTLPQEAAMVGVQAMATMARRDPTT